MSSYEWRLKEQTEYASTYWLVFKDAPESLVSDDGMQWSPSLVATVKWDGCVHLNHYYNGVAPGDDGDNDDNVDYMHICNLGEFVNELTELKVISEGVVKI